MGSDGREAGEVAPNADHGAQGDGAEAVELAERLSTLDDAALRRVLEESRIVIRPGGQVVFENLTADLLEVAVALNPDASDLTCRLEEEEDEPSGEGSR